jgi:hypothetical protein
MYYGRRQRSWTGAAMYCRYIVLNSVKKDEVISSEVFRILKFFVMRSLVPYKKTTWV